jgi:cysteine desulfurase
MRRIYLDHNSTTPIDPRVALAMQDVLTSIPLNPSSVHWFGQEAKKILTRSRDIIAHGLKVKPQELIFTSGGTESLNTLIRGFYSLNPSCHIITSNVEHISALKTLQALEKKGAKVTYLPVGLRGTVLPADVESAITPQTKLLIFMSVNNVTGVKTDIQAIAKIAEAKNIPLIVDAVCQLGKETFLIPNGVSAMAFSAHKLYGPQGVGAHFVRSSFKFDPQITGGPQEMEKRGGTQNLPGIVGFAKAVELLQTELPHSTDQMNRLRLMLIDHLSTRLGNIIVHGEGPHICNTANIAFPGVDAESLALKLDQNGVAVSLGSACASGSVEPSHVLINMGLPLSIIKSSLRFSLGRTTTEADITDACSILLTLLRKNVM